MEVLKMTQHSEQVKTALDIASVFTAFGAFFDMLPTIAALFSIVWTGMRMAEMVTGKPFNELIKRKKKDE
jgi:hypothetical protein